MSCFFLRFSVQKIFLHYEKLSMTVWPFACKSHAGFFLEIHVDAVATHVFLRKKARTTIAARARWRKELERLCV